MNKVVIFDLDGTLMDTLPDIAINVNLALEHYGYPTRSLKEFRRFLGNGARILVKRSMGWNVSDSELDKCLEYYNGVYTKSGSPNTVLFDGIKQLLLQLKAKNYKLAILTNKPQVTTDAVYERYLKDFEFDLVVGQSERIKCKPDKDGVLYILKTLNVMPENACFIGDGDTDVLTAINAGIKSITCLWGYRDKDELEEIGAKVFVNHPSEILPLLEI